MDIRLALMAGIDIPIPECQLTIHQPTIKEIAYIGDEDFFKGIQCLCLNKNQLIQDKSVLDNVNNFQVFMMVMNEKETADKKTAVNMVLNLIFPKYKILFSPRSIMFHPLQTENNAENISVDENNFEALQEVIKSIFCLNGKGSLSEQNFNPANAKAKEIADKIMRGRQRVAAQNGQANASIFVQYLSVLTIALPSMSLFDLLNITMYQLYDLVERYGLYVNWDLDIKSRLAGAKAEKPPENWMKNIHT